jgi:hypothetical protein
VEGDSGRHLVTIAADGGACDCRAVRAHCSQVEAVPLIIGGQLPEPARRRLGLPAHRPSGRLWTGYWRRLSEYEAAGLVPVRTSLGPPKWIAPARARAYSYVAELAPAGGLFDIDDVHEFRSRYRERLDGFGADVLEGRFLQIAEAHGGKPLILLCFEVSPSDCHRGVFAEWWLERTGETVSEFDPRSTGGTENGNVDPA